MAKSGTVQHRCSTLKANVMILPPPPLLPMSFQFPILGELPPPLPPWHEGASSALAPGACAPPPAAGAVPRTEHQIHILLLALPRRRSRCSRPGGGDELRRRDASATFSGSAEDEEACGSEGRDEGVRIRVVWLDGRIEGCGKANRPRDTMGLFVGRDAALERILAAILAVGLVSSVGVMG